MKCPSYLLLNTAKQQDHIPPEITTVTTRFSLNRNFRNGFITIILETFIMTAIIYYYLVSFPLELWPPTSPVPLTSVGCATKYRTHGTTTKSTSEFTLERNPLLAIAARSGQPTAPVSRDTRKSIISCLMSSNLYRVPTVPTSRDTRKSITTCLMSSNLYRMPNDDQTEIVANDLCASFNVFINVAREIMQHICPMKSMKNIIKCVGTFCHYCY